MASRLRTAIVASGLVLAASTLGATQAAAGGGVKAGLLTCDVSSGWGVVLGSSRSISCTYKAVAGGVERYTGKLSKLGVDLGYLSSAVIVWAVFAPAINTAPGALDGVYAGATGSATLGVGLGANVLIGGGGKSITLQPVSLEGDRGVNVGAGIGAMTLNARTSS